VNVLGRFAATVTLGTFKLTGAGETDFFVAGIPR
jgi:hypothetical protein